MQHFALATARATAHKIILSAESGWIRLPGEIVYFLHIKRFL